MAPCDIVLGILSYALTIQFLLRTEILKEMLFCKGRGEKKPCRTLPFTTIGGNILQSETTEADRLCHLL